MRRVLVDWRGLALAGGLLAGASGQAATLPVNGQDLAGVWDLSSESSNSKCRIALRAGQSASGRQQITIPLSCLKAFPDLAPVAAWEVTGEGHLNLFDAAGQTVLDFTPEESRLFHASGPQGGVYHLAVLQTAPQKKDLSGRGAGTALAPITPAAAKKDTPPAAIPAADMAGRYSILRDGGKDTGCMLTLESQAKGPGGKKASLAPGCRDQGIVIFDPAGWQIVNGRLMLTARKGHKTSLDVQPDGSWKKDPKEGKSLILKKL
ncbi:AprI/Inh family metalloprotease inhibitor [Methylocapsa sp. D3K7]|uniref:AprI/Inh family metalloprotease inhibitor n=1 Tax=Methylocapsa sp. D3K7 TaxID=3041435 RepID=UPI00244EFC28|nr:AprI/Inh family metalloprotease inhibitor [Methylocapsa sp. D3K7]WGJ14604.1 AprI/Inh family metalloprotease inhibitor [Methylocapsa sp. D3K7]